MSEVTFHKDADGSNTIDYINGEWATAHGVSAEDVEKMRKKFDYFYIAKKYGWS